MTRELTKESVLDFVKGQGADLCGIADLSGSAGYVKAEYGDFFAGFPRAVSFALVFPREIVQEQLDGPTRGYVTYYGALNRELDRIAFMTSNLLQKAGFRAYPIPASDYRPVAHEAKLHWKAAQAEDISALPKVRLDLQGIFSHRLAASLAGLGWVGKSLSIVTPEYGPRVRLCTVLTDAPLEADAPIENRCGSCRKCADACPAAALYGRAFSADEAREERFDAPKCSKLWHDVGEVFGVETCGLCLAACPWGSR